MNSGTHVVSESLTQGSGGGLNLRGMAEFRMPRSLADELTKILYLLEGKIVAAKMEYCLE